MKINKNHGSDNVPQLRFPEFENDGMWKTETISDLSKTVTAGGTPSTNIEEYWGGNIRWMNSGELNLKIVEEVEGRITKEGLKNSSTKIIPENSVLIGLAGQGKTRGTVAINKVKLCTNQSIASIYPNEDVFDSEFLYHNLDNRYNELRELSAGGKGRGGLNLKIIRGIKIPIPPKKNEQQKIAACLASLDEVITAETEKLDLLQVHKKGLLQQLFPAEGETQPKYRFPEFKNDGDWEETTLDEVAKIIMGSSPKSSSYNEIKIGLPLVQGNADIKNRKSEPRIYTSEITKECEIDDILLSVRAPVGTVAKSLHNACIGRGISAIRGLNNYSQEFLYQWLLSFEPNWTNISQGGTFDSVNSSDIKGLALLIPPKKEEQQKIAQCLSAADELIEAQTQKIEALQEHKKGLLQQLFPNVND